MFLYTRWYEFWSSKLCEGDLITCMICIPNEFWSTFEALHIIGLFSDHVLKMKFGPLSNCRQNELWSTFDFRCNHWYESGAKFILAAIWKWTKLHFKHVIWESPEHMWRLAGGSKFIRYAYPAREKVSFTHFTGSKFIPSGNRISNDRKKLSQMRSVLWTFRNTYSFRNLLENTCL